MTLYTADRLADMLGVCKTTVQRLIRAGEFGPTVNVARQHLVTEAGLESFVAHRTGKAVPAAAQPKPTRRRKHTDPGPI